MNTLPHQGTPGNELPSRLVSRRPSRRDFLALSGAGVLAALHSSCSRDLEIDITTLHFASLAEVAQLIKAKQVSPIELTQMMLDRITAVDARLKSYATVMTDKAMAAAQEAEQEIQDGKYRGPLHGVPIALKDLCYTKGVRTMGGSKVLADFVPDHDATVVSKLIEAGAVILGKLNMTEAALAGYHGDFDIPINPWGEDLWTGISSSGSGVATAAGLCFASLGSDTGGSIRMPAAANGIVGLKPTYGRVSRFGILPLAESLDHIGPLARSTKDAAVLFEVIAGFDAKDPTSLREPVPNMLDALAGGVEGVRVGFDRAYSEGIQDRGLIASIEAALGQLEQMGAEISEVKLPVAPANAHTAIVQREAHDAHRERYADAAGEYGLFAREFIGLGEQVTDGQYSRAIAKRKEYASEILSLYSGVDVIAMPGGRMPYPIPAGAQYGGMQEVDQATPWPAQFMVPANMAGTPTLSLTCGFSETGLPYTMQLMGDRLGEPLLCRIGHAFEEATEWQKRQPPVWP